VVVISVKAYENTHVVADVGHWVEVGLEKLAESCAVMAWHKKRLPSRSITGLVRLCCLRYEHALLDLCMQAASSLLFDA
jgi:hypothetical protein